MTSQLDEPRRGPSRQTSSPARATRPRVYWFAALGAAILVVNVALLTGWVTGPDFARVPQGADQPPTFMRIALDVGQILLPLIVVGLLYLWVVRPWLRERRITYDGLLCLAALAVSMWDCASIYVVPWFSYNSHLLNFGNPLSALPGWTSANEPGTSIAWSFPVLPAFYAISFPLIGIMGCALLRATKRRFPGINGVGLLSVCVAGMVVFELLLEGLVFLPLGYWSLAGGGWPILSGGHYYQLPVNDFLHVTACMIALVFLRYSVNDRGQSVLERGADQIAGSPIKVALVRFCAVVAGLHVIVFALYHVPNAIWSVSSREWPKDVTDRSYFQNQCGPRVDRACPGPDVPIGRPASGYVNWGGQYVQPAQP